MGITGLLPFLKKIHTPVNIGQFEGCTVAIDAYCWLHKGAFSCADKLAMGEETDQYVFYCMKYVHCLVKKGIKPILVFDGCHLPSKKAVEKTRRERRELNKKKAAKFLREGKRTEAKECLQRCVDITPQMALRLMNACRELGVDCIVAPYEADAQLAYLNRTGIAQLVITEDSDLLLFGCSKVIFKMDLFGNGTLVEQSRLNEVLQINSDCFTFDKFRYMCILSGCDYLPSLPGIGLVKANKVFRMARQPVLDVILKKIPSYLKMKIDVPDDYISGFVKADNTFMYQLVFDPLTRQLLPLNPYLPEVDAHDLLYAGPFLPDDKPLQIALGNLDVSTMQRIGDFNPATYKPRKCCRKVHSLDMLSIWDRRYRVKSHIAENSNVVCKKTSLLGKETVVNSNIFLEKSPVNRKRKVPDSEEVKLDGELVVLYNDHRTQPEHEELPPGKKTKIGGTLADKELLAAESSIQDLSTSIASAPAITVADVYDISAQQHEHSLKKTSPPKKNKFALSSTNNLKFNLNAVKSEVRSRYFANKDNIQFRETSLNNSSTKSKPDKSPTADKGIVLNVSSQEKGLDSCLNIQRHNDSTSQESTGQPRQKLNCSLFSWSKVKVSHIAKVSIDSDVSSIDKKDTLYKCPRLTGSQVVSSRCADFGSASVRDVVDIEGSCSDAVLSSDVQVVIAGSSPMASREHLVQNIVISDVTRDEATSNCQRLSLENVNGTSEEQNVSPLLNGQSSCRVSGLSRIQKKPTPCKNKQKNIKDMFSRFAFNKK